MNNKVGVLGGGSWGTALSILLAEKGYEVTIWVRDEKLLRDINENHENTKYLKGVKLPGNLRASLDIEKAIEGSRVILSAIPTHGVRETLERAKDFIREDQIIVNVSKGIENGSLKRISELVYEVLPKNTYVVLSGPSHAEEVAINMPTTVLVSSEDEEVSFMIQDMFMTENFRVYTNNDVVGVELGGALKNVIALGAGISDGLNYGDNAKAALMNRGIFEMARLGEKMGAKAETFTGLSGIGDLIVTCTSEHSRNKRAGSLIGQGYTMEEAIEKTGMVVEGIKTAKSTYELAQKYKISMPITEEIYKVLYLNEDVEKAVKRLMLRDKKPEMEHLEEKELYR